MARGGSRPGAGRKPGFHHSERTRERIRTWIIVNRLQAFCLGENDPSTGKPVVMSASQVTAALGLLKKTLPDLKAVEHSGDVEAMVYVVTADPPTEAEWQERYGGTGRH
jgi:hypothetical protein